MFTSCPRWSSSISFTFTTASFTTNSASTQAWRPCTCCFLSLGQPSPRWYVVNFLQSLNKKILFFLGLLVTLTFNCNFKLASFTSFISLLCYILFHDIHHCLTHSIWQWLFLICSTSTRRDSQDRNLCYLSTHYFLLSTLQNAWTIVGP